MLAFQYNNFCFGIVLGDPGAVSHQKYVLCGHTCPGGHIMKNHPARVQCTRCSSICTLVQFLFVPVQNILSWYKIFCAIPMILLVILYYYMRNFCNLIGLEHSA